MSVRNSNPPNTRNQELDHFTVRVVLPWEETRPKKLSDAEVPSRIMTKNHYYQFCKELAERHKSYKKETKFETKNNEDSNRTAVDSQSLPSLFTSADSQSLSHLVDDHYLPQYW